MSLGAVHILFISLCTLLAAGTGVWGVRMFVAESSALGLAYGLLSLLAVPALMVYGARVRRKLKEVEA
jgi:hypothetical protein